MRFVRVANAQTASKVLNDLKTIPQKLIDITNEFGTQIYCFNERFKPSYIGLAQEGDHLGDGRSLDEVSHYDHQEKALYIFDHCSMIDPDIIKGWKKQKGLDCYANTNPREYFAQAFMAYMYSNLETYKPWSYREHTSQELKEKNSEMYYYLKNIIEN